jgi:hypothetical protein
VSEAQLADWIAHRVERNSTCGQWRTEAEAEEELVRFLEKHDLFVVYRQVAGEPLWKHHFQAFNALRADLLLLPDRRLIESGWQSGAIVIDTKRSGEKIGPGLNQVIDYTNAVFYIDGGVAVVPTFGFLFPVLGQVEAVASIMAHQHLGSAFLEQAVLHFYCGHTRILSIAASGDIRLGNVPIGRRLGRR